MAHNIADLFEHAVDAVPESPALRVEGRTVDYATVERDANRLGHHLLSQGVGPGDHVAIYARNGIEHVVALLAVFKIRAVAINVNFRYVEDELNYLFNNADVAAVIHEQRYAGLVARCWSRHPKLRVAVVIDGDGSETDHLGDFSSYGGIRWDQALDGQRAERDFGERSADDLHIIYTGGTTGFPKGVMWRHEDWWRVLGGGIDFNTGEERDEFAQSRQAREQQGMIAFPLTPLMHGGAQSSLLMRLFTGDLTVLEPTFDPVRTWEIVDREKVQLMFLTGDAVARPLIEAHERHDVDGRSLVAVASSSAIFSPAVKARWKQALPAVILTESVGATETGFQGMGLQGDNTAGADGPVVAIGPHTVILDEDRKILDPATDIGKVGMLARRGSVPVGYYKEPEKSAETFPVIDGERFSIPGDFARIEEGNRMTMLGRGSNCVNTGGEKVYPEEVEMAIKSHPAVYDALVVGVPDDRYGQAVAAVVELREGTELDLEELRTFLRPSLAGYKLPRRLRIVEAVPRTVVGKAVYAQARRLATEPFSSEVSSAEPV